MKLTDEELKKISEAVEAATPGPWEVMNNRDIFTHRGATNRAGITADENDGWHIADTMCGPTSVDGEDWEFRYHERHANAHLIANAPTWLKAQQAHIEAITADFKAQHAYDNEVIADNGRMIQLLLEQVKRMEGELVD